MKVDSLNGEPIPTNAKATSSNGGPAATSGSMKPLLKVNPPTREQVSERVTRLQASDEVKSSLLARFVRMFSDSDLYENESYQVLVSQKDCPSSMVHLAVSRQDDKPVHSWSDLQAIKNQLCGPESEGVELYPAESRLLDISNTYHLWVFTNTKDRFPFGIKDRAV
jgi:hypothetical protein